MESGFSEESALASGYQDARRHEGAEHLHPHPRDQDEADDRREPGQEGQRLGEVRDRYIPRIERADQQVQRMEQHGRAKQGHGLIGPSRTIGRAAAYESGCREGVTYQRGRQPYRVHWIIG